MNTEEIKNQKIIDDNYKRQARSEALRAALNNKPSYNYSQGIGGSLQQSNVNYDLLKEADKIYNWLIDIINSEE